ncbi:MAG: thioredoxin family protein [bacterium]
MELTDADFEEKVLKSNENWLVEFYKDICMPCKRLAPTLDQLAQDMSGELKVGKINTSNQKKL